MIFTFMLFCSVGFLGMSCLAALTKKFGAITSAIVSTIRKGLTVVLSYIIFPEDKIITLWHVFGAIIFLFGLFIRAFDKPKISKGRKSRNITSPRDIDLSVTSVKSKDKMIKEKNAHGV